MPKNVLKWIHYFGFLMTKGVYGYLFYQNFRDNANINTDFNTILYTFMAMGLISTLAGVILARKDLNEDSKLGKMVFSLYGNSSNKISPQYLKMILSLGFVETAAVLGLAGYLTSSVPLFFYIMIGMSVVGWLAAIPLERTEAESLDQLD